MIKKGITLLVVLCFLSGVAFAQSINFNVAYPVIPGVSAAAYGLMNEHDGYILYGGTNDSTYLGDPGIIKIDSVGNVVWKKYYHRSGYEFVIYQNSIELGMNVPWGGEIGVTTWLNDTSGLNPYWGLYRFDGKGDTLWTRNYQDTTNLVISQIEIPRDNKYLIYGGWDYFPTHGLGFCTIFLRKTDSLGNIIWTRTYHSTNSHIRDPAGIDTCKV